MYVLFFSDSDNDPESTVIIATNKRSKTNPNVHKTNAAKLKQTENAKQLNTSENDSSDTDNVTVKYKSKRTIIPDGPKDQGATAIIEIDTEKDRDAHAIFQKSLEINKSLEGKEDDKVYRGLNNYTQFFKKEDTAMGNASSGLVRRGPIRAPEHLRATVRWDYQPDICKDYKETGFCGFGDSCKFLHDRTDYKAGWQLEQEYSSNDHRHNHNNDSDGDDTKYEIHSDDESLPFKCFICRQSFTDPIVTKYVIYVTLYICL